MPAKGSGRRVSRCRRPFWGAHSVVYDARPLDRPHTPKLLAVLGPLLLAAGGCRIRSTEELAGASASPPRRSASAVPSEVAPAAPDAGRSELPSESAPTSQPPAADTVALVAVAGIGTSPGELESATAALRLSRVALEGGASCLDAVVAGVAALEDDPSLNAGTGAALRLDGSVELEAAVMSSAGKLGAVAGLTSIRHPSAIARAVADSPHRLLAGAGAMRFARVLGVESFDVRTAAATQRYHALLAELEAPDGGAPSPDVVAWPSASGGAPAPWQAYLRRPPPRPAAPRAPAASGVPLSPAPAAATPAVSAPRQTPAPHPSAPVGADTVAVLARCPGGEFAGAVSSGGPWLSLPGRVGDVPVPGAALYVGAAGAVFVTGAGEQILERLLARAVYDKLVSSGSAKDALELGQAGAPPGELQVTIVDGQSVSVAPERSGAWAALDPELRTSKDAPP